jgi:hypothetical protein
LFNFFKASDIHSKIHLKCGDTDEVRPSDFTRFTQSDKTYTTNYLFNSNNNASKIPSESDIFATTYNTNNFNEILESLGVITEKQNNIENIISKTTKPLRTFLIQKNTSSETRLENEFTTKPFSFQNVPKTSSNDRTKSSLILSTLIFPTSKFN